MSYPEVSGKSPANYASMLMACFNGDKEMAEKECFNVARNIPSVPCSYWREVFLNIYES